MESRRRRTNHTDRLTMRRLPEQDCVTSTSAVKLRGALEFGPRNLPTRGCANRNFARNAIHHPSGDQLTIRWGTRHAESVRSFRSAPPIADVTKIPRSSSVSARTKAICLPYGDHAGPGGNFAPCFVSRTRVSLPSCLTSRYQPVPVCHEYATRDPSGEKAGSLCPPFAYVTSGMITSSNSLFRKRDAHSSARRSTSRYVGSHVCKKLNYSVRSSVVLLPAGSS